MAVHRRRRRTYFNRGIGRHSWKNRMTAHKKTAESRKSKYNVTFIGDKLKMVFKKKNPILPDGYRIINLPQLQKHVSHLTQHSALCVAAQAMAAKGRSPIRIIAEPKQQGLASVIQAQCQGCFEIFSFETSPKVSTSAPHQRFDINIRAVWGTMVTGGGSARLEECLGTMGIPSMSQPTFSAIEQEISDWWWKVLSDDMKAAGNEERRLAIERNDYYQGVPAISVVCDGGWSKRSHKHTYNALGGVAIIIGLETKKILHIGIRNKSCYICTTATTRHVEPPQHACFKNWEESSQAMESDIIVEGFLNAEKEHVLRYMRFIGDGDSSVYARIQESVPVWGPHVSKIECSNHACKCLRSSLEKLVDANSQFKGKGKLSRTTIIRLVSGARCAIRMRSQMSNRSEATKKLEHDIRNSIYHVLGYHDDCSEFCKKAPGKECLQQTSDVSKQTDGVSKQTDDDEPVTSLIHDQHAYWTDGLSLKDQEASRLATKPAMDLDKDLVSEVSKLLDRLTSKSARLLGNFTTNLAEAWMNIRTKFDGGKMFNRCNRGSWHARCYGGALRQNLGEEWSPKVWKMVTESDPTPAFYATYKKRLRKAILNRSLSLKETSKLRRWKKKMASSKQSASSKAKEEYGEDAVDVVPDVSAEELETTKSTYYEKNIVVTTATKTQIEVDSRLQSKSSVWRNERQKRLTSSNFGSIVKRSSAIPITPLVKRLLYGTFRGNAYTSFGLRAEQATIQEYILEKAKTGENVNVESRGLFIDEGNPFLAASTDGVVIDRNSSNWGLVEVKNLLQKKEISLLDACTKEKNFPLKAVNGQLELKKEHKYFWQVQGQLNIIGAEWLDFVVRTTNPHQLFIERIPRNFDLWNSRMLPKLKSFFFKCLLPELCCPRNCKYPGIREPGHWYGDRTTSGNRKRKVKPAVPVPSRASSNRIRTRKFLGCTIKHQWIDDEAKGTTKWYIGTVVRLIKGRDGFVNAVYEVAYEGEVDTYIIDHLVEDYRQESLEIVDT